jgi:mycothiol system anti-sigma-R factor
MNCHDVIEYISAIVDGELEPEKRREFEAHIAHCSSCRNEFEMETMTKRIVARKLRFTKTPDHLRMSILQQVYAGFPSQGIERVRLGAFLGEFLSRRFVKPAFALGVVVIAVLVGISLLSHREPEPVVSPGPTTDMVDQAVEHYSNYLLGVVELQLVSSSHDEVRSFFKDKVAFKVYVPQMKNAVLVGGVLCEHGGTKFLNLVYKIGDKVLYFHMGCSKEMKAKGKIGLCAKAEAELRETGWYFDTTRTNCSVVVWKKGDNVCSAVTDMKKEEVLALLKEEE